MRCRGLARPALRDGPEGRRRRSAAAIGAPTPRAARRRVQEYGRLTALRPGRGAPTRLAPYAVGSVGASMSSASAQPRCSLRRRQAVSDRRPETTWSPGATTSSSAAAMRSAFAVSHRLTMTAPTVWFPAATRARTGERIGSIVWTRVGVKGTSASLQMSA